jgi:hypothetical protein
MIGKKINQLATELAPVSTDLTIIGDPISGVSKKITLAQLGAIFSGAVSFYTNLASFPATGDINVIYCAKDTQKLYLWSGSAYVEVFPSQALLNTYQLRSEKGVSNGYASLDSGGKVPISQLPSSIMEYKGTWNAATNTPTLANGTGDTGDVYICNVAGTVNFGAGPLTFAVGDYVIYSGTIWQRSSGAVGTVTSVALTVGGDAISVSGSPLTTSGTLALAFSGTTSQYIRGNGTLANFPTSLVSGTGTQNRITKWSFTSGEIVNSSLVDIGGSIYNTLTNPGQFSWQFNGDTGAGLSFGALIVAGTNASDVSFKIMNASGTSDYLYMWGDGRLQVNNIPNATTDTDRFLVSDNGVIKYRTGAELLSDIGGASASGYVPYTGATANVDLGTHTLLAKNLVINHSSGSGVAASITKGGSGEALTVVKSSGSGNAASITGGVTLLSELHLTTDLADAYIASATNWNTAYSLRITSATSPLSITSNVISIAQASGSTNGYLSSTDWTTFNNKQNALTNPVTGTGTTNYLPKFTGASTIGNSIVQDNGSALSIGGATVTDGTVLNVIGNQSSVNIGLVLNNTNSTHARIYSIQNVNSNFVLYDYTANATRLTLNSSGNLGLGVTPSAWNSGYSALQLNATASLAGVSNGVLRLMNNAFVTSGEDRYITTDEASAYLQSNGQHLWYIAPSGTAGNAISFTQAMTLNASGNLSLGNTNDTYKLDVTGTGRFTGNLNYNSGSAIYPRTTSVADWFLLKHNAASDRIDNALGTNNPFTIGSYSGSTYTPNIFLYAGGAATFSSSVTANSTSGISGSFVSSNFFGSIDLENTGGTATGKWNVQAVSGAQIGGSAGSAFGIYSYGASAYRLFINSSGNIGIGTTSPTATLHVNGTIQTGSPSSGSAQPWKLGSYAAGGTGTATGVIYIEVNGQIYSIPALLGTP